MKKPVSTAQAPKAVGPYSQAISAGGTTYCSGQIGLDPATGAIVEGGVAPQAEQVFRNLRAVVEAAGADFSDVVKVNLFLVDMGDFQVVNEIMARQFEEPFPARAAVGVAALPLGALVEAEAIVVSA